MIKWGWWCVSA